MLRRLFGRATSPPPSPSPVPEQVQDTEAIGDDGASRQNSVDAGEGGGVLGVDGRMFAPPPSYPAPPSPARSPPPPPAAVESVSGHASTTFSPADAPLCSSSPASLPRGETQRDTSPSAATRRMSMPVPRRNQSPQHGQHQLEEKEEEEARGRFFSFVTHAAKPAAEGEKEKRDGSEATRPTPIKALFQRLFSPSSSASSPSLPAHRDGEESESLPSAELVSTSLPLHVDNGVPSPLRLYLPDTSPTHLRECFGLEESEVAHHTLVCSLWEDEQARVGEMHLTRHLLCFDSKPTGEVRLLLPLVGLKLALHHCSATLEEGEAEEEALAEKEADSCVNERRKETSSIKDGSITEERDDYCGEESDNNSKDNRKDNNSNNDDTCDDDDAVGVRMEDGHRAAPPPDALRLLVLGRDVFLFGFDDLQETFKLLQQAVSAARRATLSESGSFDVPPELRRATAKEGASEALDVPRYEGNIPPFDDEDVSFLQRLPPEVCVLDDACALQRTFQHHVPGRLFLSYGSLCFDGQSEDTGFDDDDEEACALHVPLAHITAVARAAGGTAIKLQTRTHHVLFFPSEGMTHHVYSHIERAWRATVRQHAHDIHGLWILCQDCPSPEAWIDRQCFLEDELGRSALDFVSPEWSDYLGTHGRAVDMIRTPALARLVRIGVPHCVRGRLWQLGSGASWRACMGVGRYWRLLKQYRRHSSQPVHEIDKDLHRSLPEHPFYQTALGIEMLRRVLTAYSWRNPHVGYCQSMNIITAVFLLFMSEEETFWLLTVVCEEMMPEYYSSPLTALMLDQHVLRRLVDQHFSRMSEHFDINNISLAIIAIPWFICLFINALPWDANLRVLDRFFLHGVQVLFHAALALLHLNLDAILNTDDNIEVFELLKSIEINCDEFMEVMDEYQEKVPLSSINELRKELRAPKSITRALISRNLGQVEENIAKEQLYAESIIEEAVSTPHRRLTPNSTPKRLRTRSTNDHLTPISFNLSDTSNSDEAPPQKAISRSISLSASTPAYSDHGGDDAVDDRTERLRDKYNNLLAMRSVNSELSLRGLEQKAMHRRALSSEGRPSPLRKDSDDQVALVTPGAAAGPNVSS